MKIIDLLNKISNGEEVPKKIKRANMIYEYSQRDEDYVNKYDVSLMSTIYCSQEALNEEIEILDNDDEEKGLPEKINNWTSAVGRVDDSNIEEYVHKLFEQQTQLYFKFNSIIDYLEKQRKGE